MITSMKVGGIGIDLSMANKCVIYDPGWNAAVEQQVSGMKDLYTENTILIRDT